MRPDEGAERRRELIRKASHYSIGFAVAGVLVAALGAALVALLLSLRGLPFLRTWLVLATLIILAALAALLVQARRNS